MSTVYGAEADLDLDLDSLDGAFGQVAVAESAAERAVSRPVPAAVVDDLLQEADGRSMPDSVALSTVLWRSARTVAPILAADALALGLAALAAHGVLRLIDPASAAGAVAAWAPLVLLPLLAAYWISDLYSEIWVHPVVELRKLTHVNTAVLLSAAAAGVLAPPLPLWCATAWLVAAVLVPLLRRGARRACAGCAWWGYPTLVIGSGDNADAVGRLLLEVPTSALRPELLTDPDGKCRNSVLPVVNDPATLESIIRAKSVRHAVVFLPELSTARLGETLDRYSGLVPHLLVLTDCFTLPTLWGASRNCGRLSGFEVRNGLMLGTLRSIKWAIDWSIAATVLLLGLPLMLVIAAAVKLTSPGPVIFRHTRIGRHGRKFKVWKFRTMRTDGDAILREHLARNPEARAEWDRDHKLRDDPRVTPLGRFLRKTSLDELPQVVNVLNGDMSLVGPRPIVTDEVWRYGNAIRHYTAVKPGITGLWQVTGRNDAGYEDRVQLDLFYIRHWSPWLDLYVLAKTVVALVSRNGAY